MGIGFWEIIIIITVALVAINPKDLPKVAYYIGSTINKCNSFLQKIKQEYLNTIESKEQ